MCEKPRKPESGAADPAQQDRAWREFVARSRCESLPFDEHLKAHQAIFGDRRPEDGPPPVWTPNQDTIRRSNLQASMEAVGIGNYVDFHAWSVQDRPAFWKHTLDRLGIVFSKPPDAILDLDGGVRDPRWLPGAELNIVDSCFKADPDRPAVITSAPEGSTPVRDGIARDASPTPDDTLTVTTYGELERLVNRMANGLTEKGLAPGHAIALYMPLNLECVIAYLAIIRAGSSVVSIADSFTATEVRRRMAIAGAHSIVTMDRYVRAGKTIPLYDTVVEAGASTVIVVRSGGEAVTYSQASPPNSQASPPKDRETPLRPTDIAWTDLLNSADNFESVTGDPYRTTNVLFSSGTTGEPKAIPWTHLTPIKSAMDGFYHQDVHGDDVTAWPTNIGWMMGPWLIYATLVNGACMALYPGATNTSEYPRFIQRAGVTMLGVIPSLVRTWRHSGAAEGVDWPSVRVFSSTGEPASRTDYLWLMSRTGYRAPVIDYLGGTEIGGGHLACTVLQPCSPAAFTTANLGVDFVILDEDGSKVEEGGTGELFLIPPALGMSQRLLNGDHGEVYYEGCPPGPGDAILRRHGGDVLERHGGDVLERHGDVLQLRRHGDNTLRLHHGYYRAQGRADDGMNLGGIKVSPLELERVVDSHPAVYESAAVAVQPEGEGVERLVVFTVLEPGAGVEESRAGVEEPGAGDVDPITLQEELQFMISTGLNPLFRIYQVAIVDELPHTASGKLIRRMLRDRLRDNAES